MSNSESFIEEVSSEVRRDRLFSLFKKWGWIGALIIVVVVGFATYREIQTHNFETTAQDLGSEVVTALNEEDPLDQIGALRQIQAEGPDAKAIVDFYLAELYQQNDNTREALDTLESLAGDDEVSIVYRDLAEIKAILLSEGSVPYDDLISRLDALSISGSPFRTIATELKGYYLIGLSEESSNQELRQEGLSVLREVYADAEASANLRFRVSQFLTALGEESSIQN